MKATDLMLGDIIGYLPTWINDEDVTIQREGDPKNPIPCKVEGLGYDSAIITNGEDSFDVSEIELYPIPLTPEILEKNGFEFGYTSDEEDIQNQGQTTFEEGWVWDEGAGSVKVIFTEGTNGGEVLVDYQRFDKLLDFIWNETINVHELQHALRLCGIEKEIVL